MLVIASDGSLFEPSMRSTRFQPVGFLDDDFGVVLQVFFRQLAGQQLRRAANAAQRVLDLVGQAAHQHLGGFLLGQLGLFLVMRSSRSRGSTSSNSMVSWRVSTGVTA